MASLHFRIFAIPSNFLRLLELISSVLALALLASWNSENVRYADLNQGEYNVISSLSFFLVVSIITSVILVLICAFTIMERKIWSPVLDLIANTALVFFWFVSSVLLAVAITSLSKTIEVQEVGLSFVNMEWAAGMGFATVVFLSGSCWFALLAQRSDREIPSGQTRMISELPRDILA